MTFGGIICVVVVALVVLFVVIGGLLVYPSIQVHRDAKAAGTARERMYGQLVVVAKAKPQQQWVVTARDIWLRVSLYGDDRLTVIERMSSGMYDSRASGGPLAEEVFFVRRDGKVAWRQCFVEAGPQGGVNYPYENGARPWLRAAINNIGEEMLGLLVKQLEEAKLPHN